MEKNIKVCKKTDLYYPKKFCNTSYMPEQLFYLGDISLCDNIVMGVVGKRDTTLRNLNISFQIGERLAETGITVLNGLAIGCDTSAIKGALTQNGKVIAILPCGLDMVYPRQNEDLVNKILENGGCVISEYECGTRPNKYRFVQRDQLQAVISTKLFVVDAEIDGGTMHTVKFARKYGKKIGCFEDLKEPMSSGNKYMLENSIAISIKDTNELISFVSEKEQEKFTQMRLFEQIG